MLRSSRTFRAIAIVAVTLGVASFALRALSKVLHGQGAETYISVRGVLVYWSSVVILFVVLAISMGVALILQAGYLLRGKVRRSTWRSAGDGGLASGHEGTSDGR
jgi:hypothetical protein